MEPVWGQMLDNGRYRLTHKIGQGGMATIYLAEDQQLKTKVVIKKNSNNQTLADQQLFAAEAQTMVKICEDPSRPSSLPMVRGYFQEGPEQYLVMQYIEGEDLRSLAQRVKGIDEQVLLYWLVQVLDALEFLHQQTPPIIHCDIKPDNIRVSKDGKQAYLVDFGIANTKDKYGTPGYAPLEQHQGNPIIQSDIYALGATLYALLSGTDPDDMYHFNAVHRKKGAVTLAPLPNKVSAALCTAVDKALAIEANGRYQTVNEMRQQISAILPATLTLPTKQRPKVASPTLLKPQAQCRLQETAAWYANPQRGPVRFAIGEHMANSTLSLKMISGVGAQVKFWRIFDWQQSGMLEKPLYTALHQEDVTAVAASKQFAASADRNHKLQLWHMATRQPTGVTHANGWLRGLAFHPDEKWLAGVNDNQELWRWAPYHLGTGERLADAIDGRQLCFSPDGRWLIIVGERNRLWIRDEQDGSITERTVAGGTAKGWLQTAVFQPDSRLFVASGSDGLLHFWHTVDSKTGKPLPPDKWIQQTLPNQHLGKIYALAMSPDGRFLAATGENQYLYIFDTTHWQPVTIQPHALGGAGLALQFGASWQYLVAGMSNGRVALLWLS